MIKGLPVQKFGPWKVEISSDNLHHGKEFPFPDGAIEKVMEHMMVLAKRWGRSAAVDGNGDENNGMYVDCLQPGESKDPFKTSICLTVHLANCKGDCAKFKILNWQDGWAIKKNHKAFVKSVKNLTTEEFKLNLQPSEYDYIWMLEFPRRDDESYAVNIVIAESWPSGLVRKKPFVSADLIMRFWIDLREFRTGENATETSEQSMKE